MAEKGVGYMGMPETTTAEPSKLRWLWRIIVVIFLRLLYGGNHVVLALIVLSLIAARMAYLSKKDSLVAPIIVVICAATAFAMAVCASVRP